MSIKKNLGFYAFFVVGSAFLNWAVSPGQPEVHAEEEIVTLLDMGSAAMGQPAKIRWRLVKRGTEEPVAYGLRFRRRTDQPLADSAVKFVFLPLTAYCSLSACRIVC